MAGSFAATASIKLVIWDLDDTFWEGTLSEEGVQLIDRHVEIVKTLVDRGIMSSIVSKNDLSPVKKVLTEAGLWDYFIFPRVAWTAKGSLIADIIEHANLRPDNVLFIDDNSINVEEARFRFPTMMVAYPQDVIPVLLDLPEAKGKDDAAHSRLKQYKQLEQKVAEQASSPLSNVEFLRQCDITLRFDYDVEQHIDRVVELINRSNQLNYTKVRIETAAAVADFRGALNRHDIFAAGIVARDRYGSHGLIGFYMQLKNERVNRLIHYVWSCRMMNAGLEQYVYERLGRPEIKVVEPVSSPIVQFDAVDWIRETDAEEHGSDGAPELLLIGSCDLTAVASYCSPKREEFVNGVKNGVMTRYDDFGFILGDPAAVAASCALPQIPTWDKNEFAAFHQGLGSSEVLIVSLSAAMKGVHCVTADDVVLRVHPEGLGHHIDFDPSAQFLRGACFYELSLDQRVDLLERSLLAIAARARAASRTFLLGANTRDVDATLTRADREMLDRYNAVCGAFCERTAGWDYVSIDDVVSRDKLLDDRHYSRMGYFDIAEHIKARLAVPVEAKVARPAAAAPTDATPLVDLVRAGRKVSRLTTFGRRSEGTMSYLKQAVKLSPLAGIVRRMLPKHGDAAVPESAY